MNREFLQLVLNKKCFRTLVNKLERLFGGARFFRMRTFVLHLVLLLMSFVFILVLLLFSPHSGLAAFTSDLFFDCVFNCVFRSLSFGCFIYQVGCCLNK